MSRQSFIPSLLAAGLLAGCALGPDAAPRDPPTPAAFREQVPAAPIWPEKDWWRGFHSADLDRLIATAETDSFDIVVAIAKIRQADAQLRISGAALLPAVNATGTQKWSTSYVSSRSRLVGSSGYTDSRSSELTASASYEVDVWGRLQALRDSAEASALASRYDAQTVALTTVSSIATTWFTALAYQDRLAVAQRNLGDAEEILRAIVARRDAGTVSDLDVAQQAALVAGIRAQIPSLRNNAQTQINALAVLIGTVPESIHVAPGTLNSLDLPEVAPGLPSALLARRPDIANAEANLAAAEANLREARAEFYPQIELTAQGGWQSAALGALFGPTSILANAASSATQTLFDNGSKQATFDLDQAKRDELVASYRKTVAQAFTDVEDALTQYRFTTEQETLERDAVAVAQRASDIARAQVLAGTSDIVTALQAQSTLFNDLDTLAQVRLARFQALVALYKALGGGWSLGDTEPPHPHVLQGVL